MLSEEDKRMSSSIEEIVIEKLRALPSEQQREVLEFMEGLERQAVSPPKTIWEEIREIVKDVPDEVWDRMPRDGAEQHDHYLYGAPKK